MYYEAEYVSKDNLKALEWYQKSAEQKNPEGMAHLGKIYSCGISIPPDQEKGMALLQESAKMECYAAWIILALMHLNGWMPSDWDKKQRNQICKQGITCPN